MSDYIISAIRTGVPILIGWIVFAINDWVGVEIDTEAVAGPVMGALIWGYYLAARKLEEKYPQVRWLGITKQPAYDGP